MKKIMISIIFVGLISIMLFPLSVSAKNISTLETDGSNGKITISGTTESGVLAVAALVYSGSDLVYMETCEADGINYSCTLNKDFENGEYAVKVADYDGGDYAVENVSVTTTDSGADSNPKTGDSIMIYVILGSLSLLSLLGSGLYIKRNNT